MYIKRSSMYMIMALILVVAPVVAGGSRDFNAKEAKEAKGDLRGKVTPQPYPGSGVEAQAYPPPGQPLPTATPQPVGPEPGVALGDCPTLPITHPCAWGIFFDGANWRAWVAYPGLDLGWRDGFISLYGAGGGVRTMNLQVRGYSSSYGHSWYYTPPLVGCGRWYIGNAYIGGEWTDIRQPNDYFFFCNYFSFMHG